MAGAMRIIASASPHHQRVGRENRRQMHRTPESDNHSPGPLYSSAGTGNSGQIRLHHAIDLDGPSISNDYDQQWPLAFPEPMSEPQDNAKEDQHHPALHGYCLAVHFSPYPALSPDSQDDESHP